MNRTACGVEVEKYWASASRLNCNYVINRNSCTDVHEYSWTCHVIILPNFNIVEADEVNLSEPHRLATVVFERAVANLKNGSCTNTFEIPHSLELTDASLAVTGVSVADLSTAASNPVKASNRISSSVI